MTKKPVTLSHFDLEDVGPFPQVSCAPRAAFPNNYRYGSRVVSVWHGYGLQVQGLFQNYSDCIASQSSFQNFNKFCFSSWGSHYWLLSTFPKENGSPPHHKMTSSADLVEGGVGIDIQPSFFWIILKLKTLVDRSSQVKPNVLGQVNHLLWVFGDHGGQLVDGKGQIGSGSRWHPNQLTYDSLSFSNIGWISARWVFSSFRFSKERDFPGRPAWRVSPQIANQKILDVISLRHPPFGTFSV